MIGVAVQISLQFAFGDVTNLLRTQDTCTATVFSLFFLAVFMCSTCNCKRWATNFTVACFFLAGGVEYSVILPTMFDYLTKQFDGEEWLYGLCLSAFSISNLFMGPLFGFVFDQTHRTKLIVLFANLFEIGGNPVTV